VPDKRSNLATLVADLDKHGQSIAIASQQNLRIVRTSFASVAALARRFSAELEQRNVARGDRVLIWGENSAEWVACFFGCVLSGVLPVPLDFASSPAFVAKVQNEVQPKLLLTSREQLPQFSSALPVLLLPALGRQITDRQATRRAEIDENDPLQIIFTSGTTGEPKGIVHTHKNVLASLRPIESEIGKYLKYERVVHPLRFLHALPLSHVFGQFIGLWIPPLLGAEVHFQANLVASEILERIHDERISVAAAPPRLLDILQDHLEDTTPALSERLAAVPRSVWKRWWTFRDIHSRFGFKYWAFVCGGAALSAESERFWNDLGFAVIQGYGMTETTALISLNHPFRAAQGTLGQILPGREVRLSPEGEVLVRGDTISSSTWFNGAPQTREEEWLRTGDLAEFDAGGNLRFRGRQKDVIVTAAGLNVHLEDLEAALLRQQGVRNATVVETTSSIGPEPLAVLILNSDITQDEVLRAANQELAEFQQIRRAILWPQPDFPRTSTGKVLKREIVAQLENGTVPSVELSGLDSVSTLDSLGRVQLQAKLEQQYGIALDDAALQQAKSVEDITRLVNLPRSSKPNAGVRPRPHSYPRWPWSPLFRGIRRAFLGLIAMPLVRLLAKPSVRIETKKWPGEPMLIVCNHITSYDAAFVLYALPKHVRYRVAIAMSGEMLMDLRLGRNQGSWWLNLLSPVAYHLITALFNVFPLPQQSGFRRSFRHAGAAMDAGYHVLVFPEGRRSDNEDSQPFKSGAGILWKGLSAPALPVRLIGLGHLKSTKENWFRSGKISVEVKPVLQEMPEGPPEKVTQVLEEAVFRRT
jgi:long-chain acyl-CoA synthetase